MSETNKIQRQWDFNIGDKFYLDSPLEYNDLDTNHVYNQIFYVIEIHDTWLLARNDNYFLFPLQKEQYLNPGKYFFDILRTE
jgi:hypothetical protein